MGQNKLIVLIALAAVIFGATVYHQTAQPEEISPEVVAKFSAWMQGQHRLYATPNEMKQRLLNFKSTLDRIEEVNSSDKGYTAGLNQFSDLSTEEFSAKYLMKTNPMNQARKSHRNGARDLTDNVKEVKKTLTIHGTQELKQAPAAFDLRTAVKGAVPPVKNQGQCGSCYAFAATTSIEFAQALNKNPSKTYQGALSPQELVDCSGVSTKFLKIFNSNCLG
jgi:Papain family cysteine protease/Cathepsin propeptide inhibitor domain (I29)